MTSCYICGKKINRDTVFEYIFHEEITVDSKFDEESGKKVYNKELVILCENCVKKLYDVRYEAIPEAELKFICERKIESRSDSNGDFE